MNKAEIALIKATMESRGWEIIEHMLRQKFVDNRRPKCFENTKDKTDAQLASEIKAAEMACRSVQGFISRLKTLSNTVIEKKQSYK